MLSYGKSVSCPLTNQNQDKKPNQGSLEDLSQDQPDQALPVSEPINIHRRSPMIRNRKTGSMEVPDVQADHCGDINTELWRPLGPNLWSP